MDFPNPWPTQADLETLVDRSSGQFIYPATILKFIDDKHSHPCEQLQLILDLSTNTLTREITHPAVDQASGPFDLDVLDPRREDNLLYLIAKLLDNERWLEKLMKWKYDDAQVCLDALHMLSRHPDVKIGLSSSMIKIMVHLSQKSDLLPQCLMIGNVKKLEDYAVAWGGFGEVWRGEIEDHTDTVCLKIMKVYQDHDNSVTLKDFMREAIVWQQLKHPNLLPFIGFHFLDIAQKQLCLISPWMEHGNLLNFLNKSPIEHINHYLLVYDVTSGLSYLHSRETVHGDLKSANILIKPDGRACIGDFGLSRVRGSNTPGLTSTTSAGKTIRYSSPELLSGEKHSTFSDIYAFGCVCYEIFSGSVPWKDLKEDVQVIMAVAVKKEHLPRPESSSLNDKMWNIMTECWNNEPKTRPSASDIFDRVARLPKTGDSIKPAPDWDTNELTHIRENAEHLQLNMRTLTKLHSKLSMLFD
ncbi:kinase-like protein [Marasmius fiardii PR-910]|nr:kinase-like protein [Marasmius fiardii PR-910]